MKDKTTCNVFYLFFLFPLISACIRLSPILGIATFTPSPVSETSPTLAVTASPTIAAGSLADFYMFAADIAAAIHDKNASFFDERSSPHVWNCLGDETQGVCQGRHVGDVLQGIPVTHNWATYRLYEVSDYKGLWQAAFAQSNTLTLVAVANQFGDNPLMPMAEQSFLAVIAVAGYGAQVSIHEVRVLFFEYSEHSWHLEGELVTDEHVEDWLTGACLTCYDTWMAWPK
ncbi:MAG: hypothetical protein MUO77_08080 [Anaerolineales bacterium]|nr:hypothetical protein [Anaerolineales bacterium]